MGWPVPWKCRVACLFFEESQQPTCPQIRHSRRWTHVSPIFKQSSQPLALGVTCWIWSRCVHCFAMDSFFLDVCRGLRNPKIRTKYRRITANVLFVCTCMLTLPAMSIGIDYRLGTNITHLTSYYLEKRPVFPLDS